MTEKRKVNIENILDSQIPAFLNLESPLFKEFLKQYYISQTHFTGILDVANNLNEYKNIDTYSSEKFYTKLPNNKCYLIDPIRFYDDVITVNSTLGFPDKYGLLQIDDEVITYTGITDTTFTGCIRGFSGITEINDTQDETGLLFSLTSAEDHSAKVEVKNLSLVFYEKLFEKFKAHYLPDFERRELYSGVDLDLLLSRARDFYLTKGTDISFKILFGILYNDNVSVFNPKEYIIKASNNRTLVTKNILVEPLLEVGQNASLINDCIGLTITQTINESTIASASIYNVEYRPTDEVDLYEFSLDYESFIYDFISTKKTTVIERLSSSIIVDSTVGFPDNGTLNIKSYSNSLPQFYTLNYSGKTINQFLNITDISSTAYQAITENDELIEDRLLSVIIDENTTLRFRLLNVIDTFDYSKTNGCRVNDEIFLSSFGGNFSGLPEFNSWIYNYSTYHNIKSFTLDGANLNVTLYDNLNFLENEKVIFTDGSGTELEKIISNILSSNTIVVNKTGIDVSNQNLKLKRYVEKTSLDENIPSYINNTYKNLEDDNVIVMSSGMPSFKSTVPLNKFCFNIYGEQQSSNDIISTVFRTKDVDNNSNVEHNLITGDRIYLSINESNLDPSTGISTIKRVKNINNQKVEEGILQDGYYYVKYVSPTLISLYLSSVDLYLSFSPSNLSYLSTPIGISTNTTSGIGTGYLYNYNKLEKVKVKRNNRIVEEIKAFSKEYKTQLLMKEFPVNAALVENKISLSGQIYNIEDAYAAYKQD